MQDGNVHKVFSTGFMPQVSLPFRSQATSTGLQGGPGAPLGRTPGTGPHGPTATHCAHKAAKHTTPLLLGQRERVEAAASCWAAEPTPCLGQWAAWPLHRGAGTSEIQPSHGLGSCGAEASTAPGNLTPVKPCHLTPLRCGGNAGPVANLGTPTQPQRQGRPLTS